MVLEAKEVTIGVLQGSTLGPLPCLIYVNDLCLSQDKAKRILFAHDKNLILSDIKSPLHMTSHNFLKSIETWFCVNKISLNATKTNYLQFGKIIQGEDIILEFDDSKIETMQFAKVLGLNMPPKVLELRQATKDLDKVHLLKEVHL
ncbi:uncharacterized protein LOC126297955 [Schistocerca gregaria]|uniref:uncharacterized protein LOC126297955 n=1 Tax=Schistocerca gregaria TaxID=7010 RepID=UPI00211EE4B1|nr:uncharacterized protein LOC126297955 [Schistocerca gregaria]